MFVSTNRGRLLVLSLFLWHSVALSDNVSSNILNIERFSAERGDAQSQYFMGEHYELGDSGLPRDLNIALNWYYKAADRGYAVAQYKIGLFHENGYAGLSGGMAAAMPWYEKAAASGYDAAKLKLQAGKEEKKSRQQQERTSMLLANKPAMNGLPLKVPQQRASEYQPEDILNKLMALKWFHEEHPAEYLPAEDMNCLRTSESEVTCFSKARERVVGENSVEFTVKSIISNFSSDGGFKTRYFYNVAEIDAAPTPGPANDPYGLQIEEGWQQPGHEVTCYVKGANGVVCVGKGKDTVRFSSK